MNEEMNKRLLEDIDAILATHKDVSDHQLMGGLRRSHRAADYFAPSGRRWRVSQGIVPFIDALQTLGYQIERVYRKDGVTLRSVLIRARS